MDFRVSVLEEGDVCQRARLNTDIMAHLDIAQTIVRHLQAGEKVVRFPDDVFCAAEVRLGAPDWAKTFDDEYDELYFTLSLRGSKKGEGIFLVGMALPNLPSDEEAEIAASNIVLASLYASKYIKLGRVTISEAEYTALDLSARECIAIDRAGVSLAPMHIPTNDPDAEARRQFALEFGSCVGAALLMSEQGKRLLAFP